MSVCTLSTDRSLYQVGKIVKLWRGLGTEVFTDADSFQVEFPEGADEDTKKRILGTVMFVNIQFFEKSGGQGE